MGSVVSHKKKPSTNSEVKSHHHGKSFCANCGNGSAVKRRSNTNADFSGAQILNVEKEREASAPVSQHKKFFFYPNKDPAEDETLYVTTSQFPCTKPKAVVVRQHVVKDGVHVADRIFTNNQSEDNSYQTSVYPKLNAALQEQHSDGKRPYQSVKDRRWSSPNVVPSSGFVSEKVLPHRTVAELRRNSHPAPAFDHHERFYAYSNCQFESSSQRPPTPSPNAWYPARRSNDYLVASSLLAMERQRDRRQAEKMAKNKDIHNF